MADVKESKKNLSNANEMIEIDWTLKNNSDIDKALNDTIDRDVKYKPYDPIKAREEKRGWMSLF